MTHEQFIELLMARKALIVHCSRPGKADEGPDALLFPDDLKTASSVSGSGAGELACSVVWPEHIKSFGAVGVILKPRSTKSIVSICSTDAGSNLDKATGKRCGAGEPFSMDAVEKTFECSSDYNEWVVTDAETVGIFINEGEQLEVARRQDLSALEGYESILGSSASVIAASPISLDEIEAEFPELPIYAIRGQDLVCLNSNPKLSVDLSTIYN